MRRNALFIQHPLATITPLQQSWSPMKATTPWITYRTRFLVKAKQLTTSLAFTDDLGRLHSGRKGDYLVESSEGVLSIAPRQIFEDVYVALQPRQSKNSAPNENSSPRIPIHYQTSR